MSSSIPDGAVRGRRRQVNRQVWLSRGEDWALRQLAERAGLLPTQYVRWQIRQAAETAGIEILESKQA